MKWIEREYPIRTCDIEGCNKKHEAKGYCKNHYKSYIKYGDAHHVDNIHRDRAKRKKEREALKKAHDDLTVRGTVRKTHSTKGTCEVEGCNAPIKSKRLCEKHYARLRRNGSLEPKFKYCELDVETCLVIGCDREHYRKGLCSTHYGYNLKMKTPYLAKTVKLCGVKGCDEIHLARGLCNNHYKMWLKVMEEHGLDWND